MKPEVLAALHAFCAAVPLTLVRRLADYLRSEAGCIPVESCRSRFRLGSEAFFAFRRLAAFFAAPAELAMALEVGAFFLEQARNRTSSLVWSGPACVLQPVRTTEQVILDIIGGAQREILLVSFAAYRVPSLLQALRDALGYLCPLCAGNCRGFRRAVAAQCRLCLCTASGGVFLSLAVGSASQKQGRASCQDVRQVCGQ